MAGHGEKKQRRQELAIAALIAEATILAAAARAKVGERTLRRWLTEDAAFVKAYRKARRAVFEESIALAQRAATGVVGTLLEVATRGAKDSDRVRAGKVLLDHGGKGVELLDLETRLADLEAARAEWPKGENS